MPRALDLGCGTGLTGAVLRPRCDWLGGIDISARMLDEAAAKGHYDTLEKADIATLALRPHAYDLIAAGDVFNYLGALDQAIGWCAGSLAPGGALVFTVEEGTQGVQLRETRRFTHARSYVEALLVTAGFTKATFTPCTLRQDRGQDVAGLAICAHLPAQPHRQIDGEEDTALPA